MNRSETRRWWQRLIDEQQRSGESIAEFCRRQGVSQASFYQWRRKLREVASEATSEKNLFVPLSVVGRGNAKGAEGVEVELPCGAVVRLPAGDERSLQQIISLLMSGAEAAS